MTIVSKSRIVGVGRRRLCRLGVLGLALMLGACSAATLTDMPGPASGPAPVQPAAAVPGYPAVHDMPPARSDIVLTKDEQKKAQAELAAARETQAKRVSETKKE